MTALAALVAGALAVPTTSPAAGARDGAFRQTQTAAGTLDRTDCATDRLAGRRGVVTTTWTSAAPAAIHASLAGADGSDWDLAIFDRSTGKRLGGSGAWGASEVVTANVAGGQALEIQACRLSGSARTAQLEIASTLLPVRGMAELPPAPKVVDIELPYRNSLGLLQALDIDVADSPHAHGGGITAITYTPDELDLLKAAGFEYRVVTEDLNAFDARERAKTKAYQRLLNGRRSPLPSGRDDYRMYEDFAADLKKLAADYPAIVRPITLPKKTFQGREQIGVEISSDVNRTDDQKPVALLVGVHHAREWPAGELILEMGIHLAKNFGNDEAVTELLRRVRVVVVPIINPDGYVSSRTATSPSDELGAPSTAEAAGNGGSFAYRRKNCKGPDPSAPCDLNGGVDPNRNYGFGWGGRGASTMPNSQTYRGTGPFSEEETQSVHEFSQKHDVTAMLTMHNFASLVLRPPGRHTDGLAPDEEALKALGDAMAADTGYTSQYGWELYDTSGTTEDWNYGAAGSFGYTMELGPESGDGGNFHISYDRGVVEQWTGNGSGRGVRRALMRVVEAAGQYPLHSTLVGRAPAGRVLRLKKDFKTSTSEICTIATVVDLNIDPNGPTGERPDACVDPTEPILFDDGLEYTTRVPANSVFSWTVTPSTRPFEFKAGKRESWTLTCEDEAGKVYETKQVTIWRNEVQSFEMPCGGTLPTSGPSAVTPTSIAQAQSLTLVDRTPPETTFAKRFTRASRRRIVLGGGSRDSAPEGLTPHVAQVHLSIARRAGKRCRFLDDQGRFTKRTRCGRLPYVVARVRRPGRAARWKYAIGARLPKGRYVAVARGVDAEGNLEPRTKTNVLRFKIR
ncbi:MAG TPA: M14 family zinc carboxypeptidase [Solirubrobacteraceae bacterium]